MPPVRQTYMFGTSSSAAKPLAVVSALRVKQFNPPQTIMPVISSEVGLSFYGFIGGVEFKALGLKNSNPSKV